MKIKSNIKWFYGTAPVFDGWRLTSDSRATATRSTYTGWRPGATNVKEVSVGVAPNSRALTNTATWCW